MRRHSHVNPHSIFPITFLTTAALLFSMQLFSQDLTINNAGQTGTSGSNWSSSGTNPVTITFTGTANINTSVIQGYLNSGTSVVILGASSSRDILLQENILKSAGGEATITFRANRDIKFQSKGITSTSNKVNIVIISDNDDVNNGAIYLDGATPLTVNTNGGHIWMGGAGWPSGSTSWNGLTVGPGFASSFDNTTSIHEGVNIRAATITTGGGDLYIAGMNNRYIANMNTRHGVLIHASSSINTGAGDIDITGRLNPRNGFLSPGVYPVLYGVDIYNSSLQTTSGAITITGGEGSTEDNWNRGGYSVQILNSTVQSTGSTGGNITITGTTGTNSGNSAVRNGVFLSAQGANAITNIASVAGNIQITGTDNSNDTNGNSGGLRFYTYQPVDANNTNPTIYVTSSTGNITLTGDNPNYTHTAGKGIFLDGSYWGKVYLGSDGSNDHSGNLTLNGRSIKYQQFAGGYLSATGSGQLTLQPTGNSFVEGASTLHTFDLTSQWNLGSNHSSVTIGKPASVNDVTTSIDINAAGPLTIYGQHININQNINTSAGAGNGDILLKGAGDITLARTKSITTSGGDVILWANSDGQTSNGGVFFDGNSSVSTGGGHIWMGGGSGTATWNGLTVGDGFAVSGKSILGFLKESYSIQPFDWECGIFLDEMTINSGGGNIYMAGKRNVKTNYDSGAGIINYNGASGTTIDAGSGTITWVAEGANLSPGSTYGTLFGLHPNASNGIFTIRSSNATATNAINISATTLDSDAGLVSEDRIRIISTATTNGGGISITASSGGTTGIFNRVGSLSLLSASGDILVDAGADAIANETTGSYRFGAISGDADVPASTADVTVISNNLAWTGTNPVVTTGSLTIKPVAGSAFSSTFNTQSLTYTGITELTIGHTANTGNVTVGSATTIAGPISIYGLNITINSAMSTTVAGGDILIRALGYIDQTVAAATITTQGGSVIFWSDADGSAGTDYIYLRANVTTNGGHIYAGGGSATETLNGLTVPTGYAHKNTSWDFGLMVRNSIINSGGGDIRMKGRQSGVNENAAGLIVINSTIQSGTGKLELYGSRVGDPWASAGLWLGTGIGSGTATGNVTLSSTSGNIYLEGLSSSTNTYAWNHGLALVTTGTDAITISSTSGNITMSGDASGNPATFGESVGLVLQNGSGGPIAINTDGGEILLSGKSGNTGDDFGASFRAGNAAGRISIGDSNSGDVTLRMGSLSTSPQTVLGVVSIQSAGAYAIEGIDGNAFNTAINLTDEYGFGSNGTSLRIGSTNNNQNLTIGATANIGGPISVYGNNLTLNGPLTATANDIDLNATGAVTQGSGGALNANGLALHGTGTFTLTNTSNNVTTIAGGDGTTPLGSLSYTDANTVTIGTVNPTGITSSGNVLIETVTGNINLNEDITTTSTNANAIILNAGKSKSPGMVQEVISSSPARRH